MSSLRSDLEKEGFSLPEVSRSNLEVAKEIAEGGGSLIGKHKTKRFFLVIDGLGYDLLNMVMNKSPALSKAFSDAKIEKIKTMFPSFTPSVMTSIDSGLTIAEHGIVGSPIPMKEYGNMLDVFNIPWGPSLDEALGKTDKYPIFPEMQTLIKMSRRKGFLYLQHENILNKGRNLNALNKINYSKYISMDDMIIQVLKAIKSNSKETVYVYIDYVDHAQHVYSKSTYDGLEITRYALERLAEKLIPALKQSGWETVITSDHGQGSFNEKDLRKISPQSKVMENLTTYPWGTHRSMFFNAVDGKGKLFEDEFQRSYGKSAYLADSDEAIKSGLFGKSKVSNWLRYRFGTHIAIAKGSSFLYYKYPDKKDYEKKIFGHHGGMSKDEMEIPLVIV
ncbi:MAG: alkaline phosphatase family protein [Candidatus Marsarchaeota archaeon]|nr:alkaline phosphatase family protein [Candidatus Marsarchaeota archaeon]